VAGGDVVDDEPDPQATRPRASTRATISVVTGDVTGPAVSRAGPPPIAMTEG
jgi:hypothetical protein